MKKEGMTRRKIKGAETKNRLYESAGKLFEQFEFDEVSVDDIARKAKVSKGTFYVHFESKDALITSLIADYVRTVDMDYLAHLDSLPENMPGAERLLSLVDKITDVLMHGIGHNRLSAVYKVQLSKTVNMDNVNGYDRELYKIVANEIKDGIQKGEFRSDLPEQVAQHFVMAIRGISYEWCVRYPHFDFKEQALTHTSLILSGMLAK